ncbi:MAG: DUF362 domain-containing protein [Elusimicrobiota bacterium]|jgi:uncharacterized protein (DUF362 family)/NAD-dependent dihydropyrimidine dehydrogenase PreA subunit|nr:DUF362 domain-containing protein [Elusimicrobiota bacterium]
MPKKISILKCEDYNEANDKIEQAIELLGSISTFIKSGEKILLKPNLLAARSPEEAITTHPEIVRAAIRLVKKAGATPIVGDSPGGYLRDMKNLWRQTGMRDVCEQENVELVSFEAVGARSVDIGDKNIRSVTFSNAVLDCNGIINLPKLKTHSLMSFTCGVKNLYGTIPGLLKVEYHKHTSKTDEFSALLANIYKFLASKIRLTIVDAVLAMDGNGPSGGNVKKLGFISASPNTPEQDAYLLGLLGYDFTRHSLFKKLNIKKRDVQRAEILPAPNEIKIDNFKFPKTRILDKCPKFLVKFLGKFLWIKPEINDRICRRCMICGNTCPVRAIYVNRNNCLEVDKKRCISCFCCHEMCPYNAITFKKSFLAKLFLRDDINADNKN